MHVSTRAAVLAASLLLAAGASGLVLAACGGSSTADSRAQAGPSGMPQANGQMGDPSAMIAKQLDALVEDGTITIQQQTAVVAAIKTSMPGGAGGAPQGAQPSPGAQPPSGRSPQIEARCSRRRSPRWSRRALITAAQQTAIEAALTQGMPGAPSGAQAPTDGSSTHSS